MKQLFQKTREAIQLLDKWMIFCVIFLQGIGLIMIYSITSITEYNGTLDEPLKYVAVTVVAIALGIIAFSTIYAIPYKHFRMLGRWAVVINVAVLVFTLAFGGGPNVRSWIDVGPLSIQPAEFVKIGMAFAVAYLVDVSVKSKMLEPKKLIPRSFDECRRSYWGIGIYIILCLALVAMQPDMGMVIIIMSVGLITLACSGIRLMTIVKLVGPLIPVVGLIVFVFLATHDYMQNRIELWLNPFVDVQGLGYQNIMGYTAMALGGLFGVGIGQSKQKYGYVIEPHNDFIVTIIAEELGMIVVILIMMVYFFMAMRCYYKAIKCPDLFGSLVLIGIGSIFLIQPAVNLGGASGALPLTGVTLPFISYGGSSTLMLFMAMGVYFNISKHVKRSELKQAKRIEEQA